MDMKLKFDVVIDKEREFKFDLEDELAINPNNLDREMREQPTVFDKFATLAAMTKAKADRAEYRLEECEAELFLKFKALKEKESFTESQIKSKITIDSKRLALVNRLVAAQEQHGIVVAAKEAFAQRKDCLISLGATRRAEFEGTGEISIKKRRKE